MDPGVRVTPLLPGPLPPLPPHTLTGPIETEKTVTEEVSTGALVVTSKIDTAVVEAAILLLAGNVTEVETGDEVEILLAETLVEVETGEDDVMKTRKKVTLVRSFRQPHLPPARGAKTMTFCAIWLAALTAPRYGLWPDKNDLKNIKLSGRFKKNKFH
jgi:hypothetical protein